MDDSKKKSLDVALKSFDKALGKGTILRLGDREIGQIGSIDTGSMGLDLALGIGGVPKGRTIKTYGPESSGRMTLTLHIIAERQEAGGVCAFTGAEHTLDVKYVRNLGADTDNLYISQPDFGEQALEIVETIAKGGAIDLIVVDSVATLTSKVEIDGDTGDQHVGLQARLMSQALRKLTSIVHKMSTTVIFISQVRMRVDAMGYGTPEATTDGNVLKFYASARLDARKVATLRQDEEPIGNRAKIEVVKNRIAPPFRVTEFNVMYGEGLSRGGELIDHGVKLNIIDKGGAWFSYKDKKLSQGRENPRVFLKESPELADEITRAIRNSMGIEGVMSNNSEEEEE